jgi:spore germination protein
MSGILETIKEQLEGCSDAVYQSISVHGHSCFLIYISSIIDSKTLHESIAFPLKTEADAKLEWSNFLERLDQGVVFPIPYLKAFDLQKIVDLIVAGKVVLCIEDLPYVHYFEITQYSKRSVTESQNELVVIGPQEAFIEDIESNLSMLRHKIKHPDLKTVHFIIGKYTKTDVYVVYIEGLYKKEVLAEIEQQLNEIDIDGILGISYISEQLRKGNFTPFPVFQYTERPDSVAASLMEGLLRR